MQLLELKSFFWPIRNPNQADDTGRKLLGTVIWTKLDRLGDSWSCFGTKLKSYEGEGSSSAVFQPATHI